MHPTGKITNARFPSLNVAVAAGRMGYDERKIVSGVAAMNANETESRTQQIKQFALHTGADVVGVADPTAWDEHVPQGHRPSDILPGARSVVSC